MIKRMSLFAGAMSVFLVAMAGINAWHRANGTEIALAITPLDPRDMLLGYYSRLGLEIAEIDAMAIDGDDDFIRGDRAWVALEEDGQGAWRPTGIYADQPAGGVFILGRVRWVADRAYRWVENPETGFGQPERVRVEDPQRLVRLHYNVENYYLPRDQAQALDDFRARFRNGEATMRLLVSLADYGAAVIKGIEIDGERRYDRLWR
jgi:uncharacterized membrane-anchored protein